jgi:hypothetical protein
MMDKRIHVLAEQARQYATTRHPLSKIVLNVDSYVSEQKFAELIVAECTDLVQKYMSRWPEDHELTKQIKEHFGVE